MLRDGDDLIAGYAASLAASVRACQAADGGIGGGFGQLPHLACTYAATLAVCASRDEACYRAIDRPSLYGWLMRLKTIDGGFAIHQSGEVDARACYLALSTAALLDLLTLELVAGCRKWLVKCQRYEGGFSGTTHGAEAHAGLSYCAVAALCILDDPATALDVVTQQAASVTEASRAEGRVDFDSLLRWTTERQMAVEGGMSGRSNKLVDGCYSWWAGAQSAILSAALSSALPSVDGSAPGRPASASVSGVPVELLDRRALAKYILRCCQTPNRGGLVDKPDCRPDYYHTNYVLLGLSCARWSYAHDGSSKEAELEQTNEQRREATAGTELRIEPVEAGEAELEWQDVDDTEPMSRPPRAPTAAGPRLGDQAFRWTARESSEVASDAYLAAARIAGVKAAHPLFGVPLDAALAMRAWSTRQEWRPGQLDPTHGG